MERDSLYCGKWRKILNAYRDLNLNPTKLNIELVPAISYTTKYSNFVFQDRFLFELSCKHTHTHTHTQTQTHTHRDSDECSIVAFSKNEYSIVAFSKNATIIRLHRNKGMCLLHNVKLSSPPRVYSPFLFFKHMCIYMYTYTKPPECVDIICRTS